MFRNDPEYNRILGVQLQVPEWTDDIQFPLANLYNHDPIYVSEGTVIVADSMTAEQFKNYLYMMGTRGTAFWELYYSDSLLDKDKYLVNAEFLE